MEYSKEEKVLMSLRRKTLHYASTDEEFAELVAKTEAEIEAQ